MKTTILKQKRTFSMDAPTAKRVLLAGDFTRWLSNPIPLRKHPGGIWENVVSLVPGTYHYRFLVDDEWRDDPKCTVRVQNPFGTLNDVVQIPERSHRALGNLKR
jgi:1,4-alpha-glucan branching enzyme